MDGSYCCVCHIAVGQDAPHIGRRTYCADHYHKVCHNRRSSWIASLAMVGALVAFAVLVALLAGSRELVTGRTSLVVWGVVLAAVPALLWLVFFYAQDYLEQEPKSYVLAVFILGALLARSVGIPLVRELFAVQGWMGQSLVIDILAAILVIGFVQEFLKYAAVRYSVYLLPEFDERMDGILYGTAAGLGYATMLNLSFVLESGGVDLGAGVVRIVVTALAQAAFAGISGFFLARAKFEDEPVWWLPLGLTVAAVLNGLFTIARSSVTRIGSAQAGRTASPWLGLGFSALVAAGTLGLLLALIRRSNRLNMGNWYQTPLETREEA